MRVIVAGSRGIKDYELICRVIADSGFDITTLVSGGADGVDRLGERWATERGIPVDRFNAQWDLYGKKAGPYRNQKMAEDADALVAVMVRRGSRGTQDMLTRARTIGLRIHLHLV